MDKQLDAMDHVAITVTNVQLALDWYVRNFQCEVLYQDESWALLQFANVKLALVVPHQHPAHLGFVRPDAAEFGALTAHRDGTRSAYLTDPAGNAVEFLTDGLTGV
jgi:hypothetical protein